MHDWVVPGTNNVYWRVMVCWPLHFPFLVLYVDPDYRSVLFGYPDRSLGWVFARTGTIDDPTYAVLLPGIKINASPTNFHPIRQMQLTRWTGQHFERFGKVLQGEAV